jgi:ParB family chromosome partitioning protein
VVTRRNALGRGLDALIPAAPPVRPEREGQEAPVGSELAVSDIAPNPDQPRRRFDDTELARLADSIQRHGVLQPVVVRRAEAGAARPYELVVGERRWRASQRAGRATIPAVVQDVEPSALLEVALIENVQRRDLNPIELAHAFRTLLDVGQTQEQIGQSVGLDRSSVANHLRLLELPKELQEDVELGALTMGHAKALLQLSNPERRRFLRDRITRDGLSVRAAEGLARSLSAPAAARSAKPTKSAGKGDPNLRSLIEQLESHLQTRVRIEGAEGHGRMEIHFHGPEELDRVARTILEGRRA